MQPVQTAANDATALARVLEERFNFSTELLIDADRYDILAALNRKRDEVVAKLKDVTVQRDQTVGLHD